MLILTRRIDQAIVIRENIFIKILGIDRDRVKIGISAPEEDQIFREELTYPEEGGRRKTPTKRIVRH